MRRRARHFALPTALLTVLAAALGAGALIQPAATPGYAAGRDALRGDLDRILADPRLAGAHAGVVVRAADTGELLYGRDGGQRLTPASSAKLFTAAAALDQLGPDHRFRTEVRGDGQRRGDVLDGDVVLRGTGDPTMLAADYDALAARVAASGIRHVRGRVVADASWFDGQPLGAGWAWDDEPYYYAAPVSALTLSPNGDFDAGSVGVRVRPGRSAGDPVAVELDPATGVLMVDDRATTGPPGSRSSLRVAREHGTNRITVTGSVPADAPAVTEFASVPRPEDYAADVFARSLRAHGVRVESGEIGHAAAPPDSPVLARRDSMPLSRMLTPFLKLSNNNHAEVLVKQMGRVARGDGSWDAGLAVLRDRLAGLGVDPAKLRLADGSGLSAMDSAAPEQFAALLRAARARPWFNTWFDALPIAGEPERMVGGTLRDRMSGTPARGNVHAKTGSMTGVHSLSGYVTAANGRPLVFSVMFNDFVDGDPEDLEDAVAVRLARYEGAADRPRPATPRQETRVPRNDPTTSRNDPATPRDESVLECAWIKAC